jgi:hypothetical protein
MIGGITCSPRGRLEKELLQSSFSPSCPWAGKLLSLYIFDDVWWLMSSYVDNKKQ